ncbi:glycosyltransferase [Lewinella sp. 4G2]|uniref:glycosyltransferase family 8 protein n=1 Tax=Lewinella sp. 4G2 TaxID=1803372 RepID=UPI0007B4D489|nr:glycosyltransferase [Lewinella sp. 4G2]OAV44836.1 hypothetical protein A3850_010190 [Lewinella sp. 4G2]
MSDTGNASSAVDLTQASEQFAIVTVCTPPFLPGTVVMLKSFLETNPWFRGDVVILTDKVTEELRAILTEIYPVKFRLIGQRILDNAAIVREAVTDRLILEVRFFAMELFAVSGYRKVLYLDSDLLITRDLTEFWSHPEPVVGVGDGFHYRDKLRTGPDYLPHKLRFWQKRSNYWSGQFNAGVLLIDDTVTTPERYQELVDMINPGNFSNKIRRFHNQKLLNIYFYQKAKLISAKFNYRLGMAEEILQKDGVRFADAHIIHYTAKRKPWMAEQSAERLEAGGDYLTAFEMWQTCWQSLPLSLRERVEAATMPYEPHAPKT